MVANAPGEMIMPGELGKAIEILAGGGDVDYSGATGVELVGPGEAAGSYAEYVIEDGRSGWLVTADLLVDKTLMAARVFLRRFKLLKGVFHVLDKE